MKEQVLWLSLRPINSSARTGEELWGQLVTWCLTRSMFVGGSLEGAAVINPDTPITRPQLRHLKAWLEKRADVHHFELTEKHVSDLFSFAAKGAYIEAVSQAQEFLAERMMRCALSLAFATSPGEWHWKPAMSPDGNTLELRLPRSQLQLDISRLDVLPEPLLHRLASGPVRLQGLESLIPELVELHWHRMEAIGDVPAGEWLAQSRGWSLSLQAISGSALDHREVMLRWMAWVCAS
ncbi:MAG TPA: hypothetical protein VE934_08760 [Polaromonas sp.]|uniref:hypothetical protein n=1 Tax=Polaromonas sp. TaxID=1869339 RepID=UPI002D739DE4|nr:hypothetical protein [Polaromonas sp.]HYW57039.1 hypothetical protein [Polaromonas sp.]